MSYRVLFTVRREYYEAIVSGTKTREIRRASPRWETMGVRVMALIIGGGSPEGVFLCGRAVHRREIVGVSLFPDARSALGRDPSDQGRADLGAGAVLAFELGRAIAPGT